MAKCEDCKYSKVRTQVAQDGTLQMDRFCFFHVPQVQLVPQARGVGQITYRPKVEDDDFCQEFKSKTSRKDANDLFDELTGQAESPKPSISTNSSGGSTGVPV